MTNITAGNASVSGKVPGTHATAASLASTLPSCAASPMLPSSPVPFGPSRSRPVRAPQLATVTSVAKAASA
jgi:hypothetical protein